MEAHSLWNTFVGRSKSKYAVRDRLHRELRVTRERVQSVTDNTWSNLDREFRRLKQLKNETVEKVHEGIDMRKHVLRSELDLLRTELQQIRAEAKGTAKSFWWHATFYLQLLGFVSPVAYALWFVCNEHPSLLFWGIIYLVCLTLFLLWSLVVPSLNQRGVSLFHPYELSPEEEDKIVRCIASARERCKDAPIQPLWADQDRETPLFILALDGGGIKGAVSARILTRICEEFPDLMDHVGLIAGTSTGSIIGGMLATGFTPAEATEMFKVASPVVFRTTVWEQLRHLGGFTGPNHDGEGKLGILRAAFRGLRMRDLSKGLCITASHVEEDSYISNHCAPRLWSNVVTHGDHTYVGHHGIDDSLYLDSDEDEDALDGAKRSVLDMQLADIVNGATAAPLYFPSHQGHVDGGLWGNNPAMAALAHVTPVKDVQRVTLLSISTGLHIPTKKCQVTGRSWGLKQWLPWIIDFLFNSTAQAVHFNCKAMLQDRYHRIEPTLPRPIALNDVGVVDELIATADAVDLTKTFRFLDRMGFRRRASKKRD